MKKIIADLYDNFLGSLDNQNNKGFSARKLTAITLTAVVVAVHIKWIALGNFNQLEMVLTIDYAFIAALFGMTTYQSIKNSPKNSIETMEQQVTDDSIKTTVTKGENEIKSESKNIRAADEEQ